MMDEEKKKMMMEKMKEMGFDEKIMEDHHAMWAGKKIMFGIMKMKWIMKENGIEDNIAKETLKKMTDMIINKGMDEKMMAKMKEKMEMRKEHMHEHKDGHCDCGCEKEEK